MAQASTGSTTPDDRAASPDGPRAVHAARWQVRLLGAVEARDGTQTLQRFPSRAVAALLARLAIAPERAHAREELVELLWPGVEAAVGRNRLRQALSTLKSLLEGPGGPGAAVLLADRSHVRVAPGALASDVQAFEQLARAGRAAEARALYRGEFMPGFYDEWVDETRMELAAVDERMAARVARAPAPADIHAAPGPDQAPPAAAQGLRAAPLATRTQLPHYLTRMFGAELSLARLREQVLAHRLVTVIGPGGSGKTRLAVEAAHGLAGLPSRFDLVAFVPLASCITREQALDAMSGALRLASAGGDAADTVRDALSGRRALLVLDNLEQLVEAVRDVVARWLAELPELHVLATSRRPLALDGEHEVPAATLALPPPQATLDEAAENPSVALFIERARAARADYHLSARNAPVIAALVHALEGMPLAIELAASRVRSISPAEMVERLRGPGAPRLELLARGGPRGALDARHASMQRVIAWSWGQLAPAQAQLLAALTVFPDGFTARAAGELAGLLEGRQPHEHDGDAALQLDDLVAQSLLTARAHADVDAPTRFGMYEPIREFAALELAAPQKQLARAGLRRWARQWASTLPSTPPLQHVREEMPNLVAALASAVDDGVPHEAIELLLVLRRCLDDVALPAEGLAHACRAVDATADPVLAGQGHGLLGPMLHAAGQLEAALSHADRALACAPLEAHQRARALYAAARVRWRSREGMDRVEPMLDEAARLMGPAPNTPQAPSASPAAASGTSDPFGFELRASVAALKAFVTIREHRRHEEGERLHAQALALWERTGNLHAINSGRYNLAVCAQNARRHADALERLAPVIASAQALGDWHRLSQSLNVRGNAGSGLRRWAEAANDYRECIRIAWRGMSDYDLAYGLWNLPRALLHLRRPEQGLPLAAFAEVNWATRFGALNDSDRRDLLRIRRLAAGQVRPQQVEALWRQGAALTLGEAVSLALA
ncbi:MAG: NACHT domain-containing protein [Rubrivivax sp.]|nr:NACHT domain-containing protein [Rubrivivax sp.]